MIISEISITIQDPDGDHFNWTIETSPNIGSNNQENGTKTCILLELDSNTTYYWFVNASDGDNTTSEIFWFKTEEISQDNFSITLSNVYPTNEEANYNPRLEITISDHTEENLNVTFRTNASGTWQILGTFQGGNGKYSNHTSDMNVSNNIYYWSINITDGIDWVNETYSYTAQKFV